MSKSIHLKLSQHEADLLLKSIESRQQDMADVHTASGNTSDKMTEWETLDNLWQRIFDMGIDAGFGYSAQVPKIDSKVQDDWTTTPYGAQK
jgi:hypothetical protein